MSPEIMDESLRYEAGVIPHDLGIFVEEDIALQALVDLIGKKDDDII